MRKKKMQKDYNQTEQHALFELTDSKFVAVWSGTKLPTYANDVPTKIYWKCSWVKIVEICNGFDPINMGIRFFSFTHC